MENVNRFGTKWDVFLENFIVEMSEDEITMSLNTAWSPPHSFCETLSMTYSVSVENIFSEPGANYSGKVSYDTNGDIIEDSNYSYIEGVYHMDHDYFWDEINSYDFPNDYDGTPDDYVKINFPFLNANDREIVIEIYKEHILDQDETKDEED